MNGNSQRIVKNTLMLYTRQLAILLVSLYTVRIVLQALGETDYGLYTVVAGIVTMFSVFSGAMSSASQRFFSYDLGKGDIDHLKKTFSMTLLIYGMVIVAAVVIMESAGLWYVVRKLLVPEGRKLAVFFIYESSVVSLCCTVLTAPYMALMIAYEDMDAYAIISIMESMLKLGVAFTVRFATVDKLVLYGILTTISTAIVTLCYRIYCRVKYDVSKFRFYWNPELFRKMFSFTGWNMFGAAVGTFKLQMVNVILNQHYSQSVVTSRGIASSVNSAVISFSQSFGTAMRPNIIKEYAAEQYKKVNEIVGSTAKVTFLLMYIFILPLGFEMESVLSIWLGEVPEWAVLFTVLTLIDALGESVSYPLMTAAQATGKIRLYQAVVGGIQFLNFPLSWIIVMLGGPVYGVFVVAISLTVLAFVARLLILPHIMPFPILFFLKSTILPLLAVIAVTIWPPYLVTHCLESSIFRVFVTTFISLMATGFVFWFLGMDKREQAFAIHFIKRRKEKR